MVDLVNTFREKYEYPDHLANDITSSVYTFANQLGEFIGPIYGGFISQNYGFESSCIFTGILNLAFFSFYFNLNVNLITSKSNHIEEIKETELVELYKADNKIIDENHNDLNEKFI